MKIPLTTDDKPYIEFRIDKNGKIKLSASSSWWGGINGRFFSSDGTEGNTCYPKDLKKSIESFKKRKIIIIEKEIIKLQNKLRVLKSLTTTL